MKKIISLVIAMIMVFAMGATAFAANVGSVPEHEHVWLEWYEEDGVWKRTCEECGITEIRGSEENEKNPNTGAEGIMGMVALISAAGAVSFKRK